MRQRVLLVSVVLLVLASAPAVEAAGYAEEVISFSTHDGLVLEGIVSYPMSAGGPFPAMVLIHGSGLHDADLTVDVPDMDFTDGEQRLFRDVARFLSRRGMTVLRYNKRGGSFEHANDQPGLLLEATISDLIADAEIAYRALARHPQADPQRMAVYGHSEGSIVAPRVARKVGNAKLVVLVGSVASGLEDILRFQAVEIYRLFLEVAGDGNGDGFVTLEELDRLDGNFGLGSFWVANVAPLLYILDNLDDGSVTVLGIDPMTDADGDGRLDIENEVVPVLEAQYQNTLADWRSGAAAGRYGQSLIAAKPNREVVAKVRSPILFCQGELDFQTPLSETLDLIEVLEASGRTDYEVLRFPNLGHSLSQPNDFFLEDGGLTILDNPTLNSMKKSTMRKIFRKVRALLSE